MNIKKTKRRAAGGVLLLMVAAVLLLWSPLQKIFDLDPRVGKVPTTDLEQLKKQVQQNADASQFTVRINSQIVLETPESEAELYLRNPQENRFDTRMLLVSDKTGKLLYTSKDLKPGEGVDKAVLTGPLEAGVQACTARFYILKDSKVVSTLEYPVTLEVKHLQ